MNRGILRLRVKEGAARGSRGATARRGVPDCSCGGTCLIRWYRERRGFVRRLVLGGLALGVAGDVLRQVAQHELADEVIGCLFSEADDRVVEHKLSGVRAGMIGARDEAGRRRTGEVRVGGLPVAVVAALNDG